MDSLALRLPALQRPLQASDHELLFKLLPGTKLRRVRDGKIYTVRIQRPREGTAWNDGKHSSEAARWIDVVLDCKSYKRAYHLPFGLLEHRYLYTPEGFIHCRPFFSKLENVLGEEYWRDNGMQFEFVAAGRLANSPPNTKKDVSESAKKSRPSTLIKTASVQRPLKPFDSKLLTKLTAGTELKRRHDGQVFVVGRAVVKSGLAFKPSNEVTSFLVRERTQWLLIPLHGKGLKRDHPLRFGLKLENYLPSDQGFLHVRGMYSSNGVRASQLDYWRTFGKEFDFVRKS